jgi:hypothetical protein
MSKAILMSILAMTVIVPALAARGRRNPRVALRRAVSWMLLGICLYAMFVIFLYPRFLG